MTLSYHTATTGPAARSPQHTAEPDPPRAQTARWAQPCPAWKAPWMGLGCGDVGAVTGGGWDVAEGVLSRYILPATSQPCCSACFDLGILRLAGLQWLPCPREPLGCPELGWRGGTGSCVTADTLGTGGWLLPNPLGWRGWAGGFWKLPEFPGGEVQATRPPAGCEPVRGWVPARSAGAYLYGCSPVCVLRCLVRFADLGKTFPQYLEDGGRRPG